MAVHVGSNISCSRRGFPDNNLLHTFLRCFTRTELKMYWRMSAKRWRHIDVPGNFVSLGRNVFTFMLSRTCQQINIKVEGHENRSNESGKHDE